MTPEQYKQELALVAAEVDAQLRGFPLGQTLPVTSRNMLEAYLACGRGAATALAQDKPSAN